MSYNCYLFGELMPETPGKLTVKIKGKNKTLDLLNEGEINFLKKPGLTDITLTLCFPMFGDKGPAYYFGLFEKAMVDKKPTQFIMTRTAPNGKLLFDTNMKVSVENYTITEDATKGFDPSVEVSLKQYRDYSTKVVTLSSVVKETSDVTASKSGDTSQSKQNSALKAQSATVTKERDTSTAPKAKTHTVKSGDTLWALAVKYLGDGSKYTEIYNANKDKISDPNLIYVGQVLSIPSG